MDFAADFKALESNQPQKVEDAKKAFHEYLNSGREAWVVNGLLDYYFHTGSLRAVEILISLREPHDKFLFDKLSETLRGTSRLQGLTLLGLIAKRSPTWLYKISSHSLLKELLRLLKVDTDMLTVMSALLLLVMLLPTIAGLIGPVLQEIFEIFSRLAAWNTNNPNKMPEVHLLHLQVGLYALFHRLYGMFPCNFLSFLRKEYSQRDNLIIFRHTIRPMLDSVKMHPFLVISGKEDETTSRRWIEKAPHDIVVECASFAVDTSEKQREFLTVHTKLAIDRPSISDRSALETSGVLDGCYTSRGIRGVSSQLQKSETEKDVWTPQTLCGMVSPHETSAPTSIPLTPISQVYSSGPITHPEGTSPPEAAVEATPETTPIKDMRQTGRGPPPIGSTVVRALNSSLGPGYSSPVSSQPSSPMRKEPLPCRFPTETVSAFQQTAKSSSEQKKESAFIAQKMQRVFMERNQLIESREAKSHKSPPVAAAQPVSPLRLINPVPGFFRGHEIVPNISEDALVDREVENVLRGDNRMVQYSSKQESQKGGAGYHQSEVRPQESGSPCPSAGLHVSDSRSTPSFTKPASSLLYYSQSVENDGRLSGGADDVKVQRALSCPEMKKSAVSQSFVEPVLDEKVEDAGSAVMNGHVSLQELPERRIRTISASVQTDSPLPYEHLFIGTLPSIPVHDCCRKTSAQYSPQTAVDASIAAAAKLQDEKRADHGAEPDQMKRLKEILDLVNLQLQFERHRREVHAERNRRLLAKSRVNRSLEEHNLALKDQVALLQHDTDLVAAEMQCYQKESTMHIDTLRTSDCYWRERGHQIDATNRQMLITCQNMQQNLDQEREKTTIVTKSLDETKATLYNTIHELQLANDQLNSGREARSELSAVQRELVIQGETQLKVRETLANVARSTNRAAELSMLKETFNHQVRGLTEQLELSKFANDALTARVVELEASVAEKNKLLEKRKLGFEEATLQDCDLYKSLESKCNELSNAHVKLLEREVDYQNKVEALTNQIQQLQAQLQQKTSPSKAAGSKIGKLTTIGSQQKPSLVGRASSLDTSSMNMNTPMRNAQQLIDDVDASAQYLNTPPDSTK